MNSKLLPQLPNSFFTNPMSDESAATVHRWHENLRQTSRQWLRGEGDVTQWLQSFSQLRRDMINRVWNITVPAAWRETTAYLLLGSAARGEDVLTSDLDHGLLFQSTVPVSSVDWESLCPYLYQFIRLMSRLGFPPCQGFVMSTNPRWVGSAQQWEERIEGYLKMPNWEHVRYLFMMVDSVVLAEEHSSPLLDDQQSSWTQIRRKVLQTISESPYLCWEMAHLGIHTTVASMSHFGGILPVRQMTVNIKTGLINPVIHSLRLLSIAEGVLEISTLGRLRELEIQQVIDRRFAKEVQECLEYGWKKRILSSIHRGAPMEDDENVAIHKLSTHERTVLKEHLQTAKTLEQMVHRRFRKPR